MDPLYILSNLLSLTQIKYDLNENANIVLQWLIALITHEDVH